MAPPTGEVRHGYTLTDLEKMTRAAVVADRLLVGDIEYRHGIAYSAIVECLYASEEPPDRGHLIRVGWQAIALDVRWSLRHAGYPDDGLPGDDTLRPRFLQFWEDHKIVPSPEAKVVETLAARQVVDTLSPIYRDALVALAVHDTYQAAAEALGISYVAFKARITVARKQVLANWFQGETPRRTNRADRRVARTGATALRTARADTSGPRKTPARSSASCAASSPEAESAAPANETGTPDGGTSPSLQRRQPDMSIYATWLAIDDDGHSERCAVYEEMPPGQGWAEGAAMAVGFGEPVYFRRTDEPCDCGNQPPLIYQGSHVNPSEKDRRGGSLGIAAIPNHCHPSVRGTPTLDGPPVEYLRLTAEEDPATYGDTTPGLAQLVLDRAQVERLRDTLTTWLTTKERW
ncbi:hypothetical protein BJF79_03835 [Actinomadura sp. CNU-125]|uniref:RNA polymerase sigma factor n=1 Tax=Actinomadura sp. CNU-125 TaxID=1904961 RepID=UPI00096449D4|nr:sigma-70 region 4 domain-containing protein [Actinomadura sp. CNU-125]OLT13040.1 hypothetical protein BJF79_03835 [Actinomadura sp. CNU-125]